MPHLPAGHMPISTSSGYHPDVGAVEKTAFSRATFAPVTMSPLASFPPPKYGPIWRESTVRRLTSSTTTTTPILVGHRQDRLMAIRQGLPTPPEGDKLTVPTSVRSRLSSRQPV